MGAAITRCPACETSFKVTAEQLAVAAGRVRCGQCMQVFVANDCIVDVPLLVDSPQPSSPATQQNEKPPSLAGEAEADEPDIEAALQFARDVPPEEPDTDEPDAELDLDWLNNEIGASDLESDAPATDGDNKDQLLFDDMGPRLEKDVVEEQLLRDQALRNSEFDTAFFDSLNEPDADSEASPIIPVRPQHAAAEDDDITRIRGAADPDLDPVSSDASDSRWALELIENLHREQDNTPLAKPAPPRQPEPVLAGSHGETIWNASGADAALKRPSNDDFSFDDDTQLDSFNIDGEFGGQLDNLDDSFDYYDAQNGDAISDFDAARRGGWLWATGVLLLILLFAAQYVAFNFDTLATDKHFRPALSRLCAALQCQLPVLENLQKISSENLVVRSNPEQNDALVVDVIITNQAEFAQPFPALQLSFSNLRGSMIASHIFYPKEYLRGDLAGLTLMPSQNPIHLEFDIADPGPDAINYKLALIRGYD